MTKQLCLHKKFAIYFNVGKALKNRNSSIEVYEIADVPIQHAAPVQLLLKYVMHANGDAYPNNYPAYKDSVVALYFLHGNLIAVKLQRFAYVLVNFCGYTTPTTIRRINALVSHGGFCRRGGLMFGMTTPGVDAPQLSYKAIDNKTYYLVEQGAVMWPRVIFAPPRSAPDALRGNCEVLL